VHVTSSFDVLVDRLDTILTGLDVAEQRHRTEIDAVATEHRKGALNLVHYTALRQQDLRELQNDLLDLGVTSLAAAEANVAAKVRAARNVVAALRGDAGPWEFGVIDQALDEGDDLLEANASALFGVSRPGRSTRVMVTMPAESAGDPDLVAAIVDAGMDVARINCAHDGIAEWSRMIHNIRKAAEQAGRTVLISMDLAGLKLRTGPIVDGPRIARARVVRNQAGEVTAPAALWLVPDDAPAAPPVVPGGRDALQIRVDPTWWADLSPGEVVHLTDVRGRHRKFTVVAQDVVGGVLATGERSAYVAEGSMVRHRGQTTTAGGIPALPQRLRLVVGDQLVLTADPAAVDLPEPGQTARIGCSIPEAVAALRSGQPVVFDDGSIEAVVESTSPGAATLRVTRTKPGGQGLGAEKGINLPETELPMPALTAEDASCLPFIAENADLVAASFVRSVADIDLIVKSLEHVGADHLGLVLKIETAQGFRALPQMLLAAMRRPRLGLMIARGDLAVEVGFERLAEVPRQILALGEAAHVPAIWATQVLETLAKTGLPSRAEITDAAAGQRAECVMLNKGPHIVEAIRALDDILERMDEVQHKSTTMMRRIHSWDGQ